MITEPLSWWISEFGAIAPIGHGLRHHLPDHWTRFHSLPESKRYAENELEYSEIVRRQLTIGNELFEIGEPIYVYRSHFWRSQKQARCRRPLAGHLMREKAVALPIGQSEEFENYNYCVHTLVTSWVPAFFDSLTREVADWKETGVAFVSPRTKNIYCPYDGGLDIFAFSEPKSSLEGKFKSWMSGREDKL